MRFLLALSVFFLIAPPARGQDTHRDPGASSLDPGTLLRVHTQSRVIEGRVVRIDADSVVVQTLNRIGALSWPDAAAVSDVVALDIGTSRSRSDGAKRLAAAGLMVGSLAGLLLAPGEDSYLWSDESGGLMLGGVIGVSLGAALGFMAPPGTQWETVPVERLAGTR